MNDKLADILARFPLPGVLEGVERFGSGLINETYLCRINAEGARRLYILQRINTHIFKDPVSVMANVEIVTRHIEERLRSEGERDPATRMPSLIAAREGGSYHRDADGGYWRMYHFIETGEVFDTVRDPQHAYEVGRALGRFQSLVSDLEPNRLHDTLPGFHITPRYLIMFKEAMNADHGGRFAEAGREIEFAMKRAPYASLLTARMEAGGLPVRIVHNDPKVNNIMIDKRTREALCMLDLDTVKPGIVHFDFGDCVRSAANPAGEDARKLAEVRFDLSLFEAIARGYLRESIGFLSAEERSLLVVSVKVITYELGLRFLTDHLLGDSYFRTKYPGHNLHRARVQFRLLESIEHAEGEMQRVVA